MKQRPVDYILQTLIFLIIVFGILMLTSASSVIAFERYHDSYYLVKKQLFSFILGIGILIFFSRFDYRRLRSFAFIALLATVGLLVAVLIPGVGVRALGAQRWIAFGPLTFQPSELAKLTLLLYLASWLDRRHLGGREGGMHFRTFLTVVGLTLGLILLQPDLGTMIVIGAIALAVYYVSGAPYKQITMIIGVGFAALLLAVLIAPYRLQRFSVFFNPNADPQGEGYHIYQSKIAIGSGGIPGVGLGHSRQKFNYLPEAAGDSIFPVIAEEMGFIISVGLVILYLAIVLRGFRIARGIGDRFGQTLAVGITTWIALQAFLNIGALSGVLPLTGVPLPFISYGGTSLTVMMAAMGILLNLSRTTKATYAS